MYHDVYNRYAHESGYCSEGANYYKFEKESFEKHINKITELLHNKIIEKDEVVLTFDDGGESSFSIIAPLLEKYGLKGLFFVVTDEIGKKGFLSESQIVSLVKRGHEIGSHSASHPDDMSILSKEERENEWRQSITQLNDIIGKPIQSVSIPNGFFVNDDIDIFLRHGIKNVYTSKIGQKSKVDDLNVIGRYGITSNYDAENIEMIITNPHYRLKLWSRQVVLDISKRVLGDKYFKIKAAIRSRQIKS